MTPDQFATEPEHYLPREEDQVASISFGTLARALSALEHRIYKIETEGIPLAVERRNAGILKLLEEGLDNDRDAAKEIKGAIARR